MSFNSTPAKNIATGVVLRLDSITTRGNAAPLRSSDDSSFVILCPECALPHTIKQLLRCDEGHVNDPGDCTGRGKVIDGVLYALNEDEVKSAKTPTIPPKVMDLRIHPLDQVQRFTRETGFAYSFLSESPQDPFYGMLCELADSLRIALIGRIVLRGKEKLYRVVKEHHGLTLVALCWPDDLYASVDPVEHTFTPQQMARAEELVKAMMTDFLPEEYTDGTADRVAAIIESKATGTPIATITPAAPAQPQIDILAALEASLAAVKGEAA